MTRFPTGHHCHSVFHRNLGGNISDDGSVAKVETDQARRCFAYSCQPVPRGNGMFAFSDDPDHVLSAKPTVEPIAGLHGSCAARRPSGHASSTWKCWTPSGNGWRPSRHVIHAIHADGIVGVIHSSDQSISTDAERPDHHVMDHHL